MKPIKSHILLFLLVIGVGCPVNLFNRSALDNLSSSLKDLSMRVETKTERKITPELLPVKTEKSKPKPFRRRDRPVEKVKKPETKVALETKFPKEFSPSGCFEELMGVSEKDFEKDAKLRSERLIDKGNGYYAIKTKYEELDAGKLVLYDIAQLYNEVAKVPESTPGTFNIITGAGVAQLMAAPENKNAVFLVASNFDLVENINAGHSYIEQYYKDQTQGPAASISALPALIVRMYYPFYVLGKTTNMEESTQVDNHGTWHNTSKWQNPWAAGYRRLATFWGEGIYTSNGYVKFESAKIKLLADEIERMQMPDTTDRTSKMVHHQIGYHKDVRVTFDNAFKTDSKSISRMNPTGRLEDLHFVKDQTQKVDQVFAAAIHLGWNYLIDKEDPSELTEQEQNEMMRLAYRELNAVIEMTLLSAVVNGRKRVYLASIGTGAFANPKASLVKAVTRCDWIIKNYGLEVYLVDYSGGWSENEALTDFVQQTGGKIKNWQES